MIKSQVLDSIRLLEHGPCCRNTHGCHHADSAVLKLHRSSALEGCNVAISSEPNRVPETDWCLHTKLTLKGKPSRSLLDGKVSPRAAGHTILQGVI